VLIIALILMMIAISLALFVVSLSRDLVASSHMLLDKLQARFDAESTAEKIKYIAATGRFAPGEIQNMSAITGFPTQLSLRGTSFKAGNSDVELIDSASRFGLWPPQSEFLKLVMLTNGIAPQDVAIAIDSLLDWTDVDDLKRLNGAEKYYYRSDNSFAYQPRNDRFMQTKEELALIRGFQGKSYDILKDVIIDTHSGRININTAGQKVLGSILEVNDDNAKIIVDVRDKRGFITIPELTAMSGNNLTFSEDYITFFPSRTVYIKIHTTVNDARDSLEMIVNFQYHKSKAFVVEKYTD